MSNPDISDHRASNQWRGVIEEYRPLLDLPEGTPAVTLREGGTPLVHSGWLSGITGAASDAGLNIENLVNKSRGDIAYTMLDVSGLVGGGVTARLKGLDGCIRVRII